MNKLHILTPAYIRFPFLKVPTMPCAYVASGFKSQQLTTRPRVSRFRSQFFIPLSIGRARLHGGESRQTGLQMVFTGIVEEMGTVMSIDNLDSEEGGVNMTIAAAKTLANVSLGDSISVNGTCLTVTTLEADSFTFGLAPETLRRTNLGDLGTGSKVNLERSLAADGRFGGHVVQGHVDCTGRITEKRKEKDAIWFIIEIPQDYMKYVVEKGYVTVDGTSLTVCDVLDEKNSFTFMMIAYTQAHVVTASKSSGDVVNIEVDITGKYIERILAVKGLS